MNRTISQTLGGQFDLTIPEFDNARIRARIVPFENGEIAIVYAKFASFSNSVIQIVADIFSQDGTLISSNVVSDFNIQPILNFPSTSFLTESFEIDAVELGSGNIAVAIRGGAAVFDEEGNSVAEIAVGVVVSLNTADGSTIVNWDVSDYTYVGNDVLITNKTALSGIGRLGDGSVVYHFSTKQLTEIEGGEITEEILFNQFKFVSSSGQNARSTNLPTGSTAFDFEITHFIPFGTDGVLGHNSTDGVFLINSQGGFRILSSAAKLITADDGEGWLSGKNIALLGDDKIAVVYELTSEESSDIAIVDLLSVNGSLISRETIDLGSLISQNETEDFVADVAVLDSGIYLVVLGRENEEDLPVLSAVYGQLFTAEGEKIGGIINFGEFKSLFGSDFAPTTVVAAGDVFVLFVDASTALIVDDAGQILDRLDVSGGGVAQAVKLSGGRVAVLSGDTVRILEPGLPDIAPLRLVLAGRSFESEVIEGVVTAFGTGDTVIGRTDGVATLLQAQSADVEYTTDTAVIEKATFVPGIGLDRSPLFAGKVEIDVETLRGTVTTSGGPIFQLAGFDVAFNSFRLRQDGVTFGASFSLTNDVGSIIVAANEVLLLDSDGLSLGVSGKLELPGPVGLNFAPSAKITAKSLSLQYDAFDDIIIGQGQFDLKVRDNTFTLDLTNDNFISWSEGGQWDLNGALRFDGFIGFGKGWGLTNAALTIDTKKKEAGASATLVTPFGIPINPAEATVDALFVYDPTFALDAINFKLDQLNKPLGNIALWLQGGEFSIFNLAASGEEAEVSFGLFATLGPSLKIAEATRFEGSLSGSLDGSSLSGELSVTYLPVSFNAFGTMIDISVGTSVGTAEWDIEKGAIQFAASHTFIGGLINIEQDLAFNKNLDFSINSKDTVTIPDYVPFLAGSVFESAMSVKFTNDGNLSNDYVKIWKEFSSLFSFELGVSYSFDGTVSLIGGSLTSSAAQADLQSFSGATPQSSSSSFAVKAAADYIVLQASWANPVADAQLLVTLPDGTIVTEDKFADFGIQVVEELGSDRQKVAVAGNPQLGQWSVSVTSSSDLGEVVVQGLVSDDKADFSFNSLSWDPFKSQVGIDFDANDSDSVAEVSFYLTSDMASDGFYIGNALENDGSSSFSSQAVSLPTGDYFVYAIVDDGINAPLRFFASQTISIQDIDPFVQITSAGGVDIAPINVVEGALSVIQVTADGSSPDAIQYSISGGSDAGLFTLDAASGRLSFTMVPDFEAPGDSNGDNVYEVIVSASDGSLSDTQTLSVNVADRSVAPRLITPDGFAGGVGGTTAVFLTSGFQDLRIIDAPGTITLSGPPGGDDILRFDGNASAYTITRVGSRVEIADGDTGVSIPVSPTGINVVFADGPRTLGIVGGQVRLGSQLANNTPAAITAPAETDPLPNLADPAVRGRLIVAEGSPVTVAGKVDVFGTSFDNELFVAAGGDVAIRGGFTGGMDTVGFSGPASDYTAVRAGSAVFIETSGTRVSIPISPTGTKLLFGNDERLLKVDTVTGKILIGTQEIGASPTPLTSNLQTSSIDASDITVSISPNGGDLMALAPSSFGEMLAFAGAGSVVSPQSLIDMANISSLAAKQADLQLLLPDADSLDAMAPADMVRMFYATAYTGMYAQAYMALDDDALTEIHRHSGAFGGFAPVYYSQGNPGSVTSELPNHPVLNLSIDNFSAGG